MRNPPSTNLNLFEHGTNFNKIVILPLKIYLSFNLTMSLFCSTNNSKMADNLVCNQESYLAFGTVEKYSMLFH